MDTNQTANTGTRNVTYDLTAVLYHALQGVENCQIYADDAQGKEEHRQFFQQAMQAQKQLAEQAKQLLHDCLMKEIQGGSQQGMVTSAMGRQGMSAGTGDIASTQTHSFEEARDDGSAFRFASGQTPGGSDQFDGAGEQDQQSDGLRPVAVGEEQRRGDMTTGGGEDSRF
ncbi:hypothetical protein [Sphingomonas humi]|uniref:Uncharacterized protein n=1 Tax=Sphingomonas humi TaxID=335630 RepID=A0ABP7RTL6_9SPHN